MLRRTRFASFAVAASLLAATTQAQVTLQLIDTLDGFTLGTGNPGSVAAADGVLYVGSLFGAGTITQIDDPLGTPTSAGQLTGTLPLAGNGYVTLDTDGTTLVAASNNSGTSDIVQVFDVASGTLRYEATAADLTPLFGGFTRIDGASVDPITGNVWLTAFGFGNPTILDANSFTDVTDSPTSLFAGSPTGTGWRDSAFDPATGNIYLRGTNGVNAGVRNLGPGQTGDDDFTTVNSGGASAGLSQIIGLNNVNLQDTFQSAINIEFLPASFTGTEDLVISNTRQGQPALTPFADQVLAFDADSGFDGANPFSLDAEGVPVAISFVDTDGVTPFTTAGSTNGIYDFSFDEVNEVLYVADEDNGVIYIFGEPGVSPGLLGDADNDGDVDGDDLIAVQTEFGNTGGVPLLGDADFDGDVDGDDLIAVQTEFGNTVSVAVPEPATVVLLALGAVAVVNRRR